MSERERPLVKVEDLEVRFVSREATVQAVNGISFTLRKGEVLGILGESGSGKSVTLRALMRLLPPGKTRLAGRIDIAGRNVMALRGGELSDLRGPSVAMIFQEPMTALDPVFTIGQQIVETIVRHEDVPHTEARRRALELLELVQIPSARRRLDAYPHQLSGGLRQRAMIAIALSCRPQLLLADEPTTALDATVQIQVLLLLRSLQEELGMAMIFVTHDLGVAAEVSHQIAVMYLGKIVEISNSHQIYKNPLHPYTEFLLSSIPIPNPRVEASRKHIVAGAEMPSPINLPRGCSFAPRCRYADEQCLLASPELVEVEPGHFVACFKSGRK